MCGIVGIVSNNKINKTTIKNMLNKIVHRGPDGFGIYEGNSFIFGHRRLSIVDLSETANQPMVYKSRYIITYNGEIYNHVELKAELEKKGYIFNTNSDTEVVMASYDFWGVECLNKFNGMWAFVIYDLKNDKFFISRDRFGKKPFYYYQDKNTFVFASEIKSILEYLANFSINYSFLDDYLKHGAREYIKETAFKDIYRFDFASYFEGNLQDLLCNFKEKKFWELRPNLKIEKFDEEKAKIYASQYYELLEDAVRIRLRADVKVGSALSGGLDSSSIVYLMNNILKKQGREELQETFSSVYKSQGTQHCDESKFINILASKLKVHSNQIEPAEKNIPAEHRKVIYMMENPPESSCMSGWHTFKLAASTDIKVTLDGQGADEQLGGYFDYITSYISSLNLLDIIREALLYFKIPNVKKYVIRGTLLGVFRNFFGDKALKFILKNIIKKDFEINLNKKLSQDIFGNLITLIHYSDHVSMGNSIESRMPFMDYRLVEFLASIPACYKMRNGWTKYLARLAFDKKLPDEIVWRRDKMGWPIPEDHWFRGNLKSWFMETISNSELVKRYNIDVDYEFNTKNITNLIRYLNIAIFESVFLKDLNDDCIKENI